jgi:hypothetical protein
VKSITQHHASARTPGPGRQAERTTRPRLRLTGRAHTASARAGILGAAAIAAVLFAGALTASAAPA